jgi:hypothetical protein
MSIKGLESFQNVFDLIQNPEKYKAKVEEVKTITAQYKEAVEAVVAIANVNDYVLSIRDREEKSKQELEAAKAEAFAIKAKAREDAKVSADALKARQEEMKYDEDKLIALRKDLESLENILADKQTTVNKQIEALRRQAEELAVEKAILKEKQDKLAAALK